MNQAAITNLRQKLDKRICEKLANPNCRKCYGTGIEGIRINAIGTKDAAVRTEEVIPCRCVAKKIWKARQNQIDKDTGRYQSRVDIDGERNGQAKKPDGE